MGYMEKRVTFTNGKQKKFLLDTKKELGLSWIELAKKLNVNCRTLEKSYQYEYCNLPYNLFIKICGLKNISKTKMLRQYKAKITIFESIIGRKAFGEKRAKLQEINIKFESEILSLNNSDIQLSRYDLGKNINLPDKLTPELAEEIGIHYGDGFLSENRHEYRLKGDKKEKEYYDLFIRKLYKNLFNLDINLKEYETTYGFEITSKALWGFKNKVLGIPAGRKNSIALIKIIKVNDTKILTSFIRGLFDTDGSVCFIKKYKNLGNYYPLITLTLKSKKLIFDVAEILSMLGLNPKISKTKSCWRIDLNGYKRLEVYSKLIGWNNPKNIVRVINWKKQYPELGKEVMAGVM